MSLPRRMQISGVHFKRAGTRFSVINVFNETTDARFEVDKVSKSARRCWTETIALLNQSNPLEPWLPLPILPAPKRVAASIVPRLRTRDYRLLVSPPMTLPN